ncbi:T6SS phospholipase effector Tle1-like catalytic domain-containing protein, partial [Pseudomonas huaxiensis]
GKGVSDDLSIGDGLLLSQIALHELYADAFAHGSPLKVPSSVLPSKLHHDFWRQMEVGVAEHFEISPALATRFNAWRQATLGLTQRSEQLSIQQTENYQPILSDKTVEAALRDQLGWITAWRIDRYAFRTLEHQTFYKEASDAEAAPEVRKKAEALRNQKQKDVEKRRVEQRARERRERLPPAPLEPGVKDFDADMGRTQLHDAATEFGEVYRRETSTPAQFNPMGLVSDADRAVLEAHLREQRQIKALGRERVSRLFPPLSGVKN